MALPGRTHSSNVGGYRYGHNGHENENEVAAGINSAEFWMYDSRLGRRWERDPIVYEGESPYACFSNNPIVLNDPRGLADKTKGPKPKKNGKGSFTQKRGKYTGNKRKEGGGKGNPKGESKPKDKGNTEKKQPGKNPTDKQKDNKNGGPKEAGTKPEWLEKANKGTAAHTALKLYIRSIDPNEKRWKAERQIKGATEWNQPDLVYDNGSIGGVWELKPGNGSPYALSAETEAAGYAKMLNTQNGDNRFGPGSTKGAPILPIPPLPNGTGGWFIYTAPSVGGAIYWTEVKTLPVLKPVTSNELERKIDYVPVTNHGIVLKPETKKKIVENTGKGLVATLIGALLVIGMLCGG